MNDKQNKNAMKELASQLRCPSGHQAEAIADNMSVSNHTMIEETIQALTLEDKSIVLEIGFGNGQHISQILDVSSSIKYHGVEISEAMLNLAISNNQAAVNTHQAFFKKVEGNGLLPFSDNHFTHIFSVNTLYFWPDIEFSLREIHRTLQEEGQLVLTFVEKEFGTKLPFTQHGFSLYTDDELAEHLHEIGFEGIQSMTYTDDTISKDGTPVKRTFLIVHAVKG
ncbi:class I SAM-dependent methyltransferase [Sphingobacterium sp. UT-1RO-CII-1]|uniref:class I SAM-dependent methyltransferase n=1 Tax=Sphingobacterium sp. UT-1RO-CII-1 TaxID=2995225 RepID=UPI00227D2708|nr:class I SAM-dependent methyltransferase [Sphingobacterium sp. UT-1RO-CII-1]MCY4779127.1 class I SAM-dependent methyltransferase [Sphingobacterium sp. UT-1RO-CII-1]